MKYPVPAKSGYTIYGLQDCKYCKMAKEHIAKTKKKKIITCDGYIERLRDRDNFFKFMQTYTKIPYQYFPMIFCDGKFIGGYKELVK